MSEVGRSRHSSPHWPSRAAPDTIDYVATDQYGLTATSTRTVLIEAATATSSYL